MGNRRKATIPSTDHMSFETFEEATAFVTTWENGKKASNEEKLAAYSLFKQATVGDVNTSRPGMFDFAGKSKWDAWEARKGMSAEEAKAEYIQVIKTQLDKYGA